MLLVDHQVCQIHDDRGLYQCKHVVEEKERTYSNI